MIHQCLRFSLFIVIVIFLLFIVTKLTFRESFASEFSQFFTNDKHIKYPKYKTKKGCIFVSVASYRDFECSNTINSLFENANKPHKIYIGICSQNSSVSNEECLSKDLKYPNNVRIHRLKHTDALGPTYARYLCSHLWEGEEYYLQIDSHMIFNKNWDKTMIDMYQELPHNKCAFTTYPPDYGNKTNKASFTCSSHFDNINHQQGTFDIISEAQLRYEQNAQITPYFSAGFFFSKSNFLYDVPYDPYLPYLFQGEEPLMAIRLYTNGWDLYNPPKPVCVHNYVNNKEQNAASKKPKFWSDNSHNNHAKIQIESKKRYLKIIGQDVQCKPEFLKHIDYYGLGNIRSVEEYFDFAGINMKNKTVTSRCKTKWVPNLKKWESR